MIGQSLHAIDAVDISLVTPRARKYETAGAASGVAKGGAKSNIVDGPAVGEAHAAARETPEREASAARN